ncbi:MAG: hypothetical protein ACK5LC_13355 [Coprobacillaceae bacterium]
MNIMKNSKKFLLALIISLSVLLTGCNDTESKDTSQTNVEETTSENTLVVGTFNIDVKSPETDVNDQRKLLSEEGVEIFGIQEVDYNLPRYDEEQYDPLTDFTKDEYKDSFFGQSVKKGVGGYGNGVVSKYEFIEEEVIPLVGPDQAEVQNEFTEIYNNYDPNSEETAEAMMRV